jgi:hypothetical protein
MAPKFCLRVFLILAESRQVSGAFERAGIFWIEIGLGENASKWMDGFSDREIVII